MKLKRVKERIQLQQNFVNKSVVIKKLLINNNREREREKRLSGKAIKVSHCVSKANSLVILSVGGTSKISASAQRLPTTRSIEKWLMRAPSTVRVRFDASAI